MADIHHPSQISAPRAAWASIKRGLAGKCPHCGEGKMFRAYLKVVEECAVCGENLSHQRSDDAAPYMTIFVVGHIIGTGILIGEEYFDPVPYWFSFSVWPIMTLILSLWLLPIMKGGLIGLQWAMKMHGFGAQDANLPAPAHE